MKASLYIVLTLLAVGVFWGYRSYEKGKLADFDFTIKRCYQSCFVDEKWKTEELKEFILNHPHRNKEIDDMKFSGMSYGEGMAYLPQFTMASKEVVEDMHRWVEANRDILKPGGIVNEEAAPHRD